MNVCRCSLFKERVGHARNVEITGSVTVSIRYCMVFFVQSQVFYGVICSLR